MFRLGRFNRRLYSTIAELHSQVSAPRVSTAQIIRALPQAFQTVADTDEEGIEKVHEIIRAVQEHNELSAGDKAELINEFLVHGLPLDYSLYFTVKNHKSAAPHEWTPAALAKLVEANPGRVDQSWDLLRMYGSKHAAQGVEDAGITGLDALYVAVLQKLLYGEKVELRDDEFEMDLARLAKAVFVSSRIAPEHLSDELAFKLIESLIKEDCLPAVYLSGVSNRALLGALRSTELAQIDSTNYLVLFGKIFAEDRAIIDKATLCEALSMSADYTRRLAADATAATAAAGDSKLSGTAALKNAKELARSITSTLSADPGASVYLDRIESVPVIDAEGTADAILAHIAANRLDVDKTAESLLIRMKLMEVYGMDRNDIQTALAKFHDYQSHEKYGLEFVQHKLITAFCYHAIESHNEHCLKIAHTLMTLDNIPISILQGLILARAEFDSGKEDPSSLELYNEYINSVSKKVNERTRRSGSGLLTESMMLASMYTNDREFAQLLFDMAVKNKIISDEHEIAIIKKLFKVYGDAFVEDNWDAAKANLKKYILGVVRRL